MASIKVE